MAKKNIHEIVREYKRTFIPPGKSGLEVPDIDAVSAAVAAGKPVIYIGSQPMKYDGKIYKVGDEILLGSGRFDHQLIQAGKFSTQERFEGFKAYKARKSFYIESVQPIELRVLQLESQESKALEAIGAIEAQLADAQIELDTIRQNKAKAETELVSVLE